MEEHGPEGRLPPVPHPPPRYSSTTPASPTPTGYKPEDVDVLAWIGSVAGERPPERLRGLEHQRHQRTDRQGPRRGGWRARALQKGLTLQRRESVWMSCVRHRQLRPARWRLRPHAALLRRDRAAPSRVGRPAAAATGETARELDRLHRIVTLRDPLGVRLCRDRAVARRRSEHRRVARDPAPAPACGRRSTSSARRSHRRRSSGSSMAKGRSSPPRRSPVPDDVEGNTDGYTTIELPGVGARRPRCRRRSRLQCWVRRAARAGRDRGRRDDAVIRRVIRVPRRFGAW